jgi:hypothetical protein
LRDPLPDDEALLECDDDVFESQYGFPDVQDLGDDEEEKR